MSRYIVTGNRFRLASLTKLEVEMTANTGETSIAYILERNGGSRSIKNLIGINEQDKHIILSLLKRPRPTESER